MLASSVAEHGFDHWSRQSKEYKIGICYLSAKQTALKNKCKDWLAYTLWSKDQVWCHGLQHLNRQRLIFSLTNICNSKNNRTWNIDQPSDIQILTLKNYMWEIF